MNGRRTVMLAVALAATGWVGLQADNEAAIGLYHRYGFDLEGRLRRYIVVDGAAFDALQMARLA